MNRESRLPIVRSVRHDFAAAAACAPALSVCPAALFVGMSGPAVLAAGTMYAVALDAARRQVEREQTLRLAARTN